LLILLVVLVLVGLLWWFWPAKPKSMPGPFGARGPFMEGPVPVRVATVTQGDFDVELKALGTVTALNTANIRPRVDGQLVKVQFEDGQKVRPGDLLAQIDPRPYQIALNQALGTLQENQAQLKNAEIDLARYKGLYAEDSIAKQTLDTQEALVEQYRATLKTNEAAVASARLNLEFSQVRAPIGGRLGLSQVDIGNLVSSGDTTPLVVITQTQPISVVFTVPETDLLPVLTQVRKGAQLQVQAWDRGEKQQLAEGVLQSLDNQIDVATGTVKLKARFANADETLFPNQFVNTRLRVETRKGVLLAPSAAVQFGSQGTFVYSVGADNKIKILKVETGPSDGERTVITQGVEAGQRLVMEGTDRLRDGGAVEVIDDTANAAAPAKDPKAGEQEHVQGAKKKRA
jgi:multidrug efflux system membrane fusion protein